MGKEEIKKSLQQANAQATAPLNRVRAIFIGNGGAGKTSLIHVLHGEPDGVSEPMTAGIEVREWPVPGTDIRADFWDFGGQVMVHAMHQLFLRESCLYVLVISARAEINATEQAEYWLEHVKAFGKDAPVIIVGNKADQATLNVDMGWLTQKYPNIAGFYPLSCAQATGAYQPQFAMFRQAFVQQLQALGTHQIMFTPAQFAVLQNLLELTPTTSVMSQQAFDDLCAKHGVPDAGPQNRHWLLDVLDKLGVIIHFPQLPFMDGYVLNPRWLTYAIYTLMYAGKSHLRQEEIVTILGGASIHDEFGSTLTYPIHRIGLIIEVMHAFKLCYSLPDQPNTIVIPALFSADAPQCDFDHDDGLLFEFEFSGFLPRHVLPELIVARHSEILNNVVWQSGVWLRHGLLNAQALIRADYHLRTISLRINGSQTGDYLMLLIDEIQKILARLSVAYREWITLPSAAKLRLGRATEKGQEQEKAPYRQLLAFAARNIREYVAESGAVYDVAQILRRFMPDTTREEHAVSQNVNIASSRVTGNVLAAAKIQDSFNRNPATAPRRRLPIGIQTFSEIIAGNYYYVDKTPLIHRLIEESKYYFLSRPRRFGKSLLLDTIKELFECNDSLFKQLAIYAKWTWTAPCPVIRISFNDGGLQSRSELERRMTSLLRHNSERLLVHCPEMDDPVEGFGELIRRTAAQYKQPVVILVDEYDKPILDHIHDPAIAREMREALKGFYSVIKGADADIGFAMITGVSKFSKVSLFSGLNNLRDITVSPAYSTLCGYTDDDIDTVFAPELLELDRQEIRRWYNGYNWLGESVYNPHGVLSLFLERKFRPWWFESATPTFLIKLLTERETWLPSLGALKADADMLSTFDVDTIPTTALMFQAGYLTIDKEELIGGTYYYQMRFPNREVEQSLYGSLLRLWTDGQTAEVENKLALYDLLARNDLAALKNLFQSFYSSIPHQWFTQNKIADYEGYYASVFYAYFVAAGLEVRVEDATNLGRIDMMARLAGHIYLFEFKVVAAESEGAALQQIKDKRYSDKYRAEGLPIYMVGVEFSRATRNVLGFEWELA